MSNPFIIHKEISVDYREREIGPAWFAREYGAWEIETPAPSIDTSFILDLLPILAQYMFKPCCNAGGVFRKMTFKKTRYTDSSLTRRRVTWGDNIIT